jgi:peroxiredoxin
VELQSRIEDFQRAGIMLFGISYDPVPVLTSFADQFGITFSLLSDEGSQTMERLGLLNRHVAEQQAYYGMQVAERHKGIPYPGILLLDEQGIVVERQFEQSYRVRPTPDLLVEDFARSAGVTPAVSAEAQTEGVRVTAWLGTDHYRPYQKLRIHVTLQMATGVHVYGQPVPEGFTPLDVEVAPIETMTVEPAELPPTHPWKMEGLDEEYHVYEGTVTATVPVHIDSLREQVSLEVRVRYQACTDSVCYPPEEVTLELPVNAEDLFRPPH